MSHREPHAATRALLGGGMRGCVEGHECSSSRPGHGLHAMADRLATITASRWVDAIVAHVDDAGFVTLVDLDGATRRVWHHEPLEGALEPGEPVALHPVYGVLVFGRGIRLSIADA